MNDPHFTTSGTEGNTVCLVPRYPIPRGRARTTDAQLDPAAVDKLIDGMQGPDRMLCEGELNQLEKFIHAPRYPYEFVEHIELDFQANALVKHLIDRQSLTIIYGAPAAGKSTLAADLAQRIARGDAWRDYKVMPSGVVYICAEAPESTRRRFKAWNEANASDVQAGVPLILLLQAPSLLDVVAVAEFIEEIRLLRLKLSRPLGVVFADTLSAMLAGGSENDPQTMAAAIEFAATLRREFSCATTYLHHSGKDSSKGLRGHSSLYAAADTVIHIQDGVARIEKARDGIAGREFGFQIDSVQLGTDEDGEPVTSAVLKHTDTPIRRAPARKLPSSARVALRALEETIGDHGEYMPGTSTIPKGVRTCRLEDWRRQFALRYGGDDRDKSSVDRAFRRAKEVLLAEEVITISSPYTWLRTKRTDTDKTDICP